MKAEDCVQIARLAAELDYLREETQRIRDRTNKMVDFAREAETKLAEHAARLAELCRKHGVEPSP